MFKGLKILVAVAGVMLLAGSASALTPGLGVNSTEYYDVTMGGMTFDYAQTYSFYEDWRFGSDNYYGVGFAEVVEWEHTHPYSVPPVEVDEAYLHIEASRLDLFGAWVWVEGECWWDDLNMGWTRHGTLFEVSDEDYVWADGQLDVSLLGWEGFRLHSSTLAMNVSTPQGGPTVPEPATMLLMGLGLVGAGVVRRFKK